MNPIKSLFAGRKNKQDRTPFAEATHVPSEPRAVIIWPAGDLNRAQRRAGARAGGPVIPNRPATKADLARAKGELRKAGRL